MADVKWIKITTDIFDDEKIRLIEAMPDADTIIAIWFKILCLAGKCNQGGFLVIGDKIPYTEDMLITIFRRNAQTVRMALSIFQDFGMVEIINGVYTIPNWEKHQNLEGLEKIREQTRLRTIEYRKRLKEKQICDVTGDATVTHCDGTEKEKELELEFKKESNTKVLPKKVSGDDSASFKLESEDEVFLSLPINEKGKYYQVTKSYLEEKKALFPALNVEQEFRSMLSWLNDNPTHRKTLNGMPRFINSWLSNNQNKAQVIHNYNNQPTKPKPDMSYLPEDFEGQEGVVQW